MTEEQRAKFMSLCIEYRLAEAGNAAKPYINLREYVEKLIDEAVKEVINVHKADKE